MSALEPDGSRNLSSPEQDKAQSSRLVDRRRARPNTPVLLVLAAFAVLALTWGYVLRNLDLKPARGSAAGGIPESYRLPVSYGEVGPLLLDAGAIDREAFLRTFEQARQPLTEAQLRILDEGSDAAVVIDRSNAYFLLNFFWAFGLANRNPVLDSGPMSQYSNGEVGRFASTAGWTLGRREATELYSAASIVPLTPEQQGRLEEVAAGVYRPCCDNSTLFPDCNHGMAMLGLLELMAARDASVDEMFEAAKYVSAFWFPRQMSELATYFEQTRRIGFAEIDARELVGRQYSSGSGFGRIREWLATNGALQELPGEGPSCRV